MSKSEKIPVIITLKEVPSFKIKSKEISITSLKIDTSEAQKNLASFLEKEKPRGKADSIKQFWIVNAIAANASPGLIKELSLRSDVVQIKPDLQLHILENYSLLVPAGRIENATPEINRMNATKLWELGIDGSGINVSVIDTGIYDAHPDIAGRVIKWADFVNGINDSAYDDHGHGTHVAGTVGGNGIGGTTAGVAPNVTLFAAKVCNSGGSCSISSIVSGIQWSVENSADIISMSLGGDRDETLASAVNNAISAGAVLVAAAGNSGPGAGTVNFPAGEKNVIAAGAVSSSDVIATFSSRGPITVDGENLTKPDVSAPGVDINSLRHDSSGYRTSSGTSMATPHVSGAAALLLQAARMQDTVLTPSQVKNTLENTSVDLGTAGKDNSYGAGRIDAYAAVIFIDTAAPSVVANGITYINGATAAKNGTAITLNATITDTVSGIKNASVDVSSLNASITDVFLANISGFWVNDSVIINASDGNYYLNVTAYDNASNVNTSARLTVTVDNTPPFFTNMSFVPDTIEAGSGSSVLEANVSDITCGVAQVSANLTEMGVSPDTTMLNNSGTWRSTVNTTRVGNFSISVNASDCAGNFNLSNIFLNVKDTTPPLINSSGSSPDSIKADGIDLATLRISAHDFANASSIRNVTVNLTQLGWDERQEMQNISGIWQYNTSTTVSGLNGTLLQIPVNVTDSSNNSNISTSILLGIKSAVNTSVGNRTSFNFIIDSTGFNASITVFESTNVSGILLAAPVEIPGYGNLTYAGAALNLSNLTPDRSIRIEMGYNSSLISENESKLRLWYYNATGGKWEITENSTVDIQNKTVSGNTTHFSIFAPLADIDPPVISNVTSTSVTVNSAVISWDTDENSQSLVNYGIVEGVYTLNASDASSVTSHSVQLTGLSPGTIYYYIVNSTDLSGNHANSSVKTFTTSSSGENTPGGSGGGGGGGGGGGASNEKYSNIELTEKYDMHIYKDKVTSYTFSNRSNPVLFINITGNASAGEINAAVEVLRNISTLVKIPPQGIVYKNINIWVGTYGFAVPRNIKEAVIVFKVENLWIQSNSLNARDVGMARWDGTGWVQLETVKMTEDSSHIYFEAKTNAFSPFAITATKGKQISASISVFTTAGIQETPPVLTPEQTGKTAGFEMVFMLPILFAVYLLLKK